MSIKDQILENGYEGVILFDSPDYDSAFLGVSTDGRAVYSYDRMVEFLVEKEDMTEEDAIDYIEYNSIGSLGFEGSPIVVRTLL